MKLYIVQHTPTKLYLPPVRSYHSTTSAELSEIPRTFYRRQDAISAAKWYARGMAGIEYEWGEDGREPIGVSSEPVKGRRLRDFVVIPATLRKLIPEVIK